jgi:hypothetical protein
VPADSSLPLSPPLAVLRPPAESLVAGGVMDPGFDWRDRIAFIRLYYSDVWSTFGEDVLAASTRSMPATMCRWCWAFATAGRNNRTSVLTRPMVTMAARRLLGEPCDKCRKRAFATLKRHVNAGRRPTSAGGATRDVGRLHAPGTLTSRAGVASPDPRTTLHDPLGSCTTCQAYRDTHPGAALMASGAPEGCPPHAWNEKPRPRPKWARR